MYYIDFWEDAKDRPSDWANLRDYHAYILTLFETGSTKWSDIEELQKKKTRHLYAVK